MQKASNFGFRSPKIFKNDSSTPNSSVKSFKRKGSLLKFTNRQNTQEYHPQNNQKPINSVYYDSSIPQKDQSFHHSIPTNQSQDSYREYSSKRSVRQSQNYGFHNERKKWEHQISLLKKQIQRFEKDIELKDKQIDQLGQNNCRFKQIQMQLIQTYRVINYYEGKVKQQQKIIMYLQGILNTEVGNKAKGKLKEGLDFKKIIEFFRSQSIELKGQLQKSHHQNTKITLKLQRLQKQYHRLKKIYDQIENNKKHKKNNYETTHLLDSMTSSKKVASIYQTRLQNAQNKIAMRRADDQYSVASSIKSRSSNKFLHMSNSLNQTNNQEKNQLAKMYGNFNSKINKIEKQLDFFKIQNQKIQSELIEKIQLIGQLTLQNDELRYILENNGNIDSNDQQITVYSKQKQQNPIDQFVTNMPKNYLEINKKKQSQTSQKKTSQSNSTKLKLNFRQVQVPNSNSNKRKNELKNLSLTEITKKLHQSKQKPYTFKQITSETVRKLRYHLIRQDVTYSKLIQTITEKLTNSLDPNQIIEEMQDIPYQLSNKQASSFVSQFKKIQIYLKEKQFTDSSKNINQPNKDLSKEENLRNFKENLKQIFKQNIPSFKNITLRKDASLTAQLTKDFKNRLAQLDPYLRDKKKAIMSFQQGDKIFRDQWHLSEEQIDFIFLKSCEQSQQYVNFDFYKTIRFFLEN